MSDKLREALEQLVKVLRTDGGYAKEVGEQTAVDLGEQGEPFDSLDLAVAALAASELQQTQPQESQWSKLADLSEITAEQVREWLREYCVSYTEMQLISLADRINTALALAAIERDDSLAMVPKSVCDERVALAVAGAYEDVAAQLENKGRNFEVSAGEPHVADAGMLELAQAYNEAARWVRQRTPADAQAALEADRDRIWQQALEAAGQLLASRAEATNSNSFRLMARSVRAIKQPEAK